jgi:hypothetical protein
MSSCLKNISRVRPRTSHADLPGRWDRPICARVFESGLKELLRRCGGQHSDKRLMSEMKTCFKKVDYDLSGLLHHIEIGDTPSN